MKKILPLFIYCLCFSEDTNSLFQEALKLENQGNYKEAMILYKKAASLSINKEDKYLLDLAKGQEHKVESFTSMKKSFFQKQINKLDDKETEESLEQLITKDFNLYPYKKNYLLPINYNFNKLDDREQIETSFQISIEKPISYNFFGFDESISAAYTQKSFWQTTKDSSPFRETNYEPEIFIQLAYKDSEIFKAYKVSLLHSSNGRNNEESRSWNRVYVEGYFQLSSLFLVPRIWYRIPEALENDDNSNIEDYYGKGDLTLLYAYKKHTFELMLRNNLEFNSKNKGAAELNWTFPLPQFFSTKNSYGLINIFSGYGNNLIDYDKEINKIGFGIAFSR
jgi:phospholipase A1/A2